LLTQPTNKRHSCIQIHITPKINQLFFASTLSAVGDQAFLVDASFTWNSLPQHPHYQSSEQI